MMMWLGVLVLARKLILFQPQILILVFGNRLNPNVGKARPLTNAIGPKNQKFVKQSQFLNVLSVIKAIFLT